MAMHRQALGFASLYGPNASAVAVRLSERGGTDDKCLMR
jgi:hypothetical protein